MAACWQRHRQSRLGTFTSGRTGGHHSVGEPVPRGVPGACLSETGQLGSAAVAHAVNPGARKSVTNCRPHSLLTRFKACPRHQRHRTAQTASCHRSCTQFGKPRKSQIRQRRGPHSMAAQYYSQEMGASRICRASSIHQNESSPTASQASTASGPQPMKPVLEACEFLRDLACRRPVPDRRRDTLLNRIGPRVSIFSSPEPACREVVPRGRNLRTCVVKGRLLGVKFRIPPNTEAGRTNGICCKPV